jgi:general secretion pathway protein F
MNEVAKIFDFRAVRPDGVVEAGTVAAISRAAAVAQVASRGLHPIDVTSKRVARLLARPDLDGQARGLRGLATLLNAGLPVSQSLTVLEELVSPCWVRSLPVIKERVDHGESLASALSIAPLALPAYVLAIVHAGEAGSGLAPALESAAEMLENRAAARAALWNALSYPMVLAVTGTASICLLVGMVLPRFAELTLDAGATLPITTSILLSLGSLARKAFLPAILVALALGIAWHRWRAAPAGRLRWDTVILHAPLIGPLRRSELTARACATMSALLAAGVPLATAMPYASKSTGEAAVAEAIDRARARVLAGQSLSSALQAEKALTITSIRLVRIGEQIGELSAMLKHAAVVESNDVVIRTKRLTRLLEPMMILLFGAIVMAVATGLLQAIYGLGASF